MLCRSELLQSENRNYDVHVNSLSPLWTVVSCMCMLLRQFLCLNICMYLWCVYFSTSIFSITRGHLMPFAAPAASLVTFQRVLQPHSWILLSETVMREKKGSQTETEEVRARREWVKAHYASQQAAHTRLQTASSPSSADAELCGEFHTYVHPW